MLRTNCGNCIIIVTFSAFKGFFLDDSERHKFVPGLLIEKCFFLSERLSVSHFLVLKKEDNKKKKKEINVRQELHPTVYQRNQKIFVKRDIKKNNNRKPKQKQLDTTKENKRLQQIQSKQNN